MKPAAAADAVTTRVPGIVSVHDRGEFDGRLWIALQLIDGVDVSALLRAAPTGLPVADVVRAVAEVADALDYADARGLVHRDVKPANILLAGTGHYLLTDFGIARMGPETSDLTGTGLTVGTVAYASPEQMQGLPVPRSDQYALAATAFHLLTGSQPFTGTNPVAVIMAHAQQPVPSVRERRPDLSPYVDRVLARAMAKTPEERFPSSRDFAAALTSTLALRPPQSPAASGRYTATVVNQSPTGSAPHPRNPPPPPSGPVLPAPDTTRRRTGLLIAAFAAVSLLVVAGVLGVWAARQNAVAGEVAQMPRRPVTPILPVLDTRPDNPAWTCRKLPGRPAPKPWTRKRSAATPKSSSSIVKCAWPRETPSTTSISSMRTPVGSGTVPRRFRWTRCNETWTAASSTKAVRPLLAICGVRRYPMMRSWSSISPPGRSAPPSLRENIFPI